MNWYFITMYLWVTYYTFYNYFKIWFEENKEQWKIITQDGRRLPMLLLKKYIIIFRPWHNHIFGSKFRDQNKRIIWVLTVIKGKSCNNIGDIPKLSCCDMFRFIFRSLCNIRSYSKFNSPVRRQHLEWTLEIQNNTLNMNYNLYY